MNCSPRPPRVLLVDDTAACRTLLELWLRDDGFDVAVAADGEEAWAALSGGSFDLVLLEVRLPRLSGLDVARRVRAAGGTVPIIAVTAGAYPGDRAACLAAGMDGYVSKPCRRGELFDEIAAVAATR